MRERYHYKTTRKAMLTLLYFSLNDKPVTEKDLREIIRHESLNLPVPQAQQRINKLRELGFIHFINNEVKLTTRGLFLIDKKEKIIENMMYGHVLKGAMDRSTFEEIYNRILVKITWQPARHGAYMKPLRALKKRELIDFTKFRVWGGGKQIKLRKE